MKKSLSILLCLASILISVLYCMNAQYKDQIRIQNLQHSSSSWQLNIPVPDGQIPAFIDFLERVSSAYDTDIVLTTFVNDPGSSRLTEYRAGIYRDSAMGLDSEDLLFGTFPQQENQFLATWPTGQQNQSGLLYDLFQDQPLIVNSLRDYVAQGHDSLSGTYTFFSPPEQREAIVEKISEFLHLDPSRLFETPWQRQYIQGPVAVFFLLLGICLLLYLLFCLYYPYSRLKEIGRLKLLGFSSLGIWKKLMRFVFLPPAVLDVFILISLWMLYPETKISFFGGLFLAQSAVLAVSALLS